MAIALSKLGMNRAIVVHGSGGFDEASLEGDNKIVFVENGKLRYSKINISEFDLKMYLTELAVSDDDSSELILNSVLDGSGQISHKHVVALNTSLVLWVSGLEDDLKVGFKRAMHSINESRPWDKFLLLKIIFPQIRILKSNGI